LLSGVSHKSAVKVSEVFILLVVIVEMGDLLDIKSAMFIFVGRDRKKNFQGLWPTRDIQYNEPGSVIKIKEEKIKMCEIKNFISSYHRLNATLRKLSTAFIGIELMQPMFCACYVTYSDSAGHKFKYSIDLVHCGSCFFQPATRIQAHG
jgi:hypothetical protein